MQNIVTIKLSIHSKNCTTFTTDLKRLLIATDLDNLQQRISPYFGFFYTEFDSFAGRLCHSS